jgi:hypothetical protein
VQDLFRLVLFSLPLLPQTHRGEAPGADKFPILREEDTSVSPPLLDQGGTVYRRHTLLGSRSFRKRIPKIYFRIFTVIEDTCRVERG